MTDTPQKKPSYKIKSIQVTLEIADKEYRNGNSGSTQIAAWVDDCPIDKLDDLIDAGLDLYLAAWQTVIGAKVATKLLAMTGPELQDIVAKVKARLVKVRALLRGGEDTAPGGATK
jgi:hypothetical protein